MAKKKARCRAVLFDFDGVLADTENFHVAAWEATLNEIGWPLDEVDCTRAASEDDRDFLRSVFAARGVEDGDVDGWAARKQRRTVEMLANSAKLYSGAIELVRNLEGRVKLAVVSGTWRENIECVLGKFELLSAFDSIVGKEDLRVPKPDPDAYLKAIAALKTSAEQAIAVEDSGSGVESALAAGVGAIALGHRLPEGPWSRGALYVETLSEVLAAIGLE